MQALCACEDAGGEMPTALDRHLDQLAKTIPGNGGEPGGESAAEGKGSAGMQAFIELAYPKKDVPLSSIVAARQAFKAAVRRGPGRGNREWKQVGPETATYQFTPLRDASSYVPNEYAAGGRTTDLAIDPDCGERGHGNHGCRMWITPAGGGVWRTENALANNVKWKYLSGSFGINSIGSITIDPNDPTSNTLWVGTGEGNTCGSGCVAGVGLYKSTDGGDHWAGPYGTSAFNARGVGTIAVKPGNSNVIYAGSSYGVRGHASSCCYGAVSQYRALIPGAPPWGLYRSTNGGSTWTLVHNGSTSPSRLRDGHPPDRQQRHAVLAARCQAHRDRSERPQHRLRGVLRARRLAIERQRDDVDGDQAVAERDHRHDAARHRRHPPAERQDEDVRRRGPHEHGGVQPALPQRRRRNGRAGVHQLTSNDPSTPAWHSFNFCTGQCWYDNFVYTPPGEPDIVYLGGSYQYGENVANHRAVLLSTDAGETFTDMTYDGTDTVHPNGIHPDEHRLVTNPQDPMQFFEASDGGLIRSDGRFVNRSSDCDSRGLAEPYLSRCHELLSRIPRELEPMNRNLPTLQFQSLSVSPFDPYELQGGTQDNGTWENFGSEKEWLQTMWGDGGQSGFDATDPHFRFHTYFDASPDVNFSDGETADWNWIADPIYATGGLFYVPIISDPVVHRTMFVGTTTALRTKTHGMGSMTLEEFRGHCNEFTGDFAVQCGDWEPLGTTPLTSAGFGDRNGGAVAAVERATTDNSTLWAATTTGRVFISANADADPASAVTFLRLDSLSTADPDRFITGIAIDPANANHAWISYSGFSAATPTTPGHIFSVTYDPGAGTATWEASTASSETCRSPTSLVTTSAARSTSRPTSAS